MRKWFLLGAGFVIGLFLLTAGEGDRRYSKFYSELSTVGAQETITLPWTSWRYNLIFTSTTAADSLHVTLTHADGDTSLVRLISDGGALINIPFYGPPITAMRVKVYEGGEFMVLAWK